MATGIIGTSCQMSIPSENQCYRIMAKMAMLHNIVAHSLKVCQVAAHLTESLNSNGCALNLDLIRAAALLHDITKTRSLKTGENHARTGALYLAGLGYPEVSEIVAQHVNLDNFNSAGGPTAAEVVNYADKRVLHDRVVSLEARLAYIQERYKCSAGELGSRLERMCDEVGRIEKKLFAELPFSPADLSKHIKAGDFSAVMAAYLSVADN